MASGSWWVVPEGTAGQLVQDLVGAAENPLTGGGTHIGAIVHVVESASKPAGAVAGPFPSQAAAQAQADAYNNEVNTTSPTSQLAQTGAGSILGQLLPGWSSGTWRAYALRALKIVLGVVLIISGVSQLTNVHLPKAVPVPV